MATLSYEEKQTLEDYLQMGGGYVLDFSDRTFQEFISEKIRVNIYGKEYSNNGSSKAKHLREFFRIESNYLVGQLLEAFISYYQHKRISNPQSFKAEKDVDEVVKKIAQRFSESGISTHIDKITPINEDGDFKKLSIAITESIKKNEPELALDRLHTFFVKYTRELCNKNAIIFLSTDSLNALFGKYVKYIENNYGFESEITKTILKTSISILEKYNDVRNNMSFAHDNKLLNYDESLYIFDTLARLKGFIDNIQQQIEVKQLENQEQFTTIYDELPF